MKDYQKNIKKNFKKMTVNKNKDIKKLEIDTIEINIIT